MWVPRASCSAESQLPFKAKWCDFYCTIFFVHVLPALPAELETENGFVVGDKYNKKIEFCTSMSF